jgi:hypothetical protein
MQNDNDEMSGNMRTWIVVLSILIPIIVTELIKCL